MTKQTNEMKQKLKTIWCSTGIYMSYASPLRWKTWLGDSRCEWVNDHTVCLLVLCIHKIHDTTQNGTHVLFFVHICHNIKYIYTHTSHARCADCMLLNSFVVCASISYRFIIASLVPWVHATEEKAREQISSCDRRQLSDQRWSQQQSRSPIILRFDQTFCDFVFLIWRICIYCIFEQPYTCTVAAAAERK